MQDGKLIKITSIKKLIRALPDHQLNADLCQGKQDFIQK